MRAQDHHHQQQQQEQSRVLQELSSMIIHILKSPPLSIIPFPNPYGRLRTTSSSSSSRQSAQVSSSPSPTAFASLFLGISMALMLFGSVTFVIGFFLMPLVMGLVLLFYAIEILFNLSEFGRSILCPTPSRTGVPAWNFS